MLAGAHLRRGTAARILRNHPAICREHGILLVMDEVMCGMGRSGKWFGVEHYGLNPDMMVLGKGLTGVTRPFPEMTCLENVGVSVTNSPRQTERGNWRESAQSVLKQMGLPHRCETPAKSLNLIEKKKLEMARALATKPDILLLDEVLGGLNSQEIQESVNLVQRLRENLGLTIFWIEHVMGAIMKAAALPAYPQRLVPQPCQRRRYKAGLPGSLAFPSTSSNPP